MIHIGLFEGIGGFSIAAKEMGWKTYATSEIGDFQRKVLQYHFPDAYHHTDIHSLTYDKLNDELSNRFSKQWRSDDIVLTGGFPCQPYSLAGKRKGKDDSRHLWPEMLRVIREIQPTWVVGENVYGLVNWNEGLVFEEVCIDLENEGYQVQPYILPACSVGAPHRRDRVWFVAHRKDASNSNSNGCNKRNSQYEIFSNERWFDALNDSDKNDGQEPSSNSNNKRLERKASIGIQDRQRGRNRVYDGEFAWMGGKEYWNNFPTQSPVRCGDDGIPDRMVDITIPRWRKEAIMALGNAVVPQVVIMLFNTINEYYKTTSSS
jgi:DNA (cytosine-5)-methyltransferase 1